MKNMSLKEIAAACGGTYHGDPALLSKEASSVAIDSRKVQKDTLFVARVPEWMATALSLRSWTRVPSALYLNRILEM